MAERRDIQEAKDHDPATGGGTLFIVIVIVTVDGLITMVLAQLGITASDAFAWTRA